MPPKDHHIRQATSNVALLSALDPDTGQHPDWAITVSFYAALHTVEAFLASKARDPKHQHPEQHQLRQKAVRRWAKKVWVDYEWLEQESRKARYKCLALTNADAKAAVTRSQRLRGMLCQDLNIPAI